MSKKSTKALASATLMSLVLTTALSAGPVKADQGQVTRVSGDNRYATAAQVATKNWKTSDNVVLVSGEGYADAVSASALAKKLDAPILLTTSDTLSQDAQSALNTLKPKNVYVVGGNASISQSIRDGLKANYTLTELGGQNRYETNVAVAKQLVKLGVSPSNVMVVGGEGYSDALSVAPVAAAKGEILLLANNNKDSIQSVINFVKDNSSKVTIVGTTGVISDAIKDALGSDATRVNGGTDRFATNLAVLNQFKSDLKTDHLYVANASSATPDNLYADALVASALAGKYTAPLVLVDKDGTDATNKAVSYIKSENANDIEVIGGTGVVPDSIIKEIQGGQVEDNHPTVGSINSNGLRQIKVVFTQPVDSDTAEDVNNYTVDGSDLTDKDSNDATKAYDKAVLQDDDKTLLITLKDARKQNDNVDVKVKKGVLSKDKSQTVPELTQAVTFSDTTAPTLDSVTPRGNKKIAVKFSSPVNVGTNPNASNAYSKFKINGKNISGFGLDTTLTEAKDAEYDGTNYWTNEIDFYFSTALDTGNNTLAISDADATALEDSAGFPVADTSQDFSVDTLTTKPVIKSITANDDGKIYINFDRPMDKKTALNKSYYEINGASQSGVSIDLKKDDTQVKISGVTGLNKNSNKLYVNSDVKDAYGNNVDDDTYEPFNLDEDTVKPTVNSVSALNDNTVRVHFSKDVDTAFATQISNYKLRDNSGTDVTNKIKEIDVAGGKNSDVTASVFDIKLKSGEKLSDSKYTITIKNIRDTASTPNVMDDYNNTFDGSADVNAEVTGVYGVKDNARKVTLTFNKEMDSSTLTKASNYKYHNVSGDTKALPSSSHITASSDNKSVTIELPDSYSYIAKGSTTPENSKITSEDNQVNKLFAEGVKDKDGNDLEVGSTGGEIETVSTVGATTVKPNSVEVRYDDDDLKVDIGFTNPIDADSIDNSKLDFYLAGVKADSASVNGDKLTLTFDSNDDSTTKTTNINTIKAAGLNAALTLNTKDVTATNTTSNVVRDVMGQFVGTGSSTVKPYYYDAGPRTIVTKTDGEVDNWTAVQGATADTVKVVFDTPIDQNSVKKQDFNFAVKGATLTPDDAKVDGNTIVFTFNHDTKVGNGTEADSFQNGQTMRITPNDSTAKTISTLQDSNDDYAYYTPTNDDDKGIIVNITGNGTLQATIEKVGTDVPGQRVVVASLPAGVDATKYDVTVEGTKLTYNADKNKFVGTISGDYTEAQLQAATVVSEKQVQTLPQATIEKNGTDVPGQTVVVASLPAGVDATKYDVTVEGTKLTYNADKNKFVGTLNGTYSDIKVLQAATVVSEK